MKTRATALLLGLAVLGAAFAATAGAALVGIYRNGMDSTAQRAQLVKLAGASCARGGADSTLRITVGEKTDGCSYRTPVLGRDLEIAATERLLSGTPTALQRRAYLALELRAGAGAKYQMLVYPLQRKVQLVKVTPEATKFLAIVKNQAAVMGVNKANALRLRAVNLSSGPERGAAKITGFLGKTKVVEASDETAGELSGRASSVLVGAGNNAAGLIASIDDVIIRVPSPF